MSVVAALSDETKAALARRYEEEVVEGKYDNHLQDALNSQMPAIVFFDAIVQANSDFGFDLEHSFMSMGSMDDGGEEEKKDSDGVDGGGSKSGPHVAVSELRERLRELPRFKPLPLFGCPREPFEAPEPLVDDPATFGDGELSLNGYLAVLEAHPRTLGRAISLAVDVDVAQRGNNAKVLCADDRRPKVRRHLPVEARFAEILGARNEKRRGLVTASGVEVEYEVTAAEAQEIDRLRDAIE